MKLGAEAVRLSEGGLDYLQFPRFADPKLVPHAVTTRVGGVSRGDYRGLNLSFKVGDEKVRVEENRSLLGRTLGMDLAHAAWVEQVHGDEVAVLTAANIPVRGGSLGKADALITQQKGIPILIQVADCLPVLFYDPVHQAIGLAHAGWRGTVSHIAVKALLAMGEHFGTKPEDVRAVLGPCIGACCYEVGEDVRQEFIRVFPWGAEVFSPYQKGQWKLDLAQANGRQLVEMGMKQENLIASGLCTVGHSGLFFSHRAEAGPERNTGRFGVLLMLNGRP
ncbi:MAG TPA: peptidoglycan editing factor PgeF [bacterium]|nr:peptidoglycan editing factor PgeF [bacterium]